MNKAIEMNNLEGKKAVSSIGMTVLLISFTMLFATLLLGYIVFRLTNDVWPPMGMERVPLTLPTLSTLVIGVSSFFLVMFEKAFMENKKSKMQLHFLLTLALGLGFMVIQFMLWGSLRDVGLYVSGGIFPSMIYSLTWIHAAHIVSGIFALLLLLPVLFKGYVTDRVVWVQNIGKFWHFLGAVWFFMYVIMFVF